MAPRPTNPLQLGAALLFAVLFVAVTLATTFARTHFGLPGLDGLAATVGVTDINSFVLSVVQGNGYASLDVAAAILIASASNNVLKAIYAFAFGAKRGMLQPVLVLLAFGEVRVGRAPSARSPAPRAVCNGVHGLSDAEPGWTGSDEVDPT